MRFLDWCKYVHWPLLFIQSVLQLMAVCKERKLPVTKQFPPVCLLNLVNCKPEIYIKLFVPFKDFLEFAGSLCWLKDAKVTLVIKHSRKYLDIYALLNYCHLFFFRWHRWIGSLSWKTRENSLWASCVLYENMRRFRLILHVFVFFCFFFVYYEFYDNNAVGKGFALW